MGGQSIRARSKSCPTASTNDRMPCSAWGHSTRGRMLASVRSIEPGTIQMPLKPLGRISASGVGSNDGSNSAATVASDAIDRVASGPKNPCVSDACGSLSISRTRRPLLASAPARWKQDDVLPTPPFWFKRVMVSMAGPHSGHRRRKYHGAIRRPPRLKTIGAPGRRTSAQLHGAIHRLPQSQGVAQFHGAIHRLPQSQGVGAITRRNSSVAPKPGRRRNFTAKIPWRNSGRTFNADFHGPKTPHISEAVAPTFSQNSKIPGGLV